MIYKRSTSNDKAHTTYQLNVFLSPNKMTHVDFITFFYAKHENEMNRTKAMRFVRNPKILFES